MEETKDLIIILQTASFLTFEIEIQHHKPQLDNEADFLEFLLGLSHFCLCHLLSCELEYWWEAAALCTSVIFLRYSSGFVCFSSISEGLVLKLGKGSWSRESSCLVFSRHLGFGSPLENRWSQQKKTVKHQVCQE